MTAFLKLLILLYLWNQIHFIRKSVCSISSEKHLKLSKCFCKELIFKCNIDRHLFISYYYLDWRSIPDLYILNLANHYSHLFHHLRVCVVGTKGFLSLRLYYLSISDLLNFFEILQNGKTSVVHILQYQAFSLSFKYS